MRNRGRKFHFTVAVSVAVLAGAVAAAAAELPAPDITGRAAVVLDGRTGRILWERDADRPLPPASTTKIMTTLLALESGRLDRSYEVSPYAAAQAPSKLGLRAGQRMQLEDLAYALILKSANDAAVVVAEGLAGSVPEFSAFMNQRAREIGATNTQFHNPNGLPDDEHLTSAHDMALILRHALTVPGFRAVAGANAKLVQIEDAKIRPVMLHSKNRLLNGYFVPVLGKTGYTRAAGRCFAGAAELNGRQVITVVFGASDMWGDTRKLMEYGFSTFDDTAPAVQLALEQARRNPPRTSVASARSKRRRATVVASRSRRAPVATSRSRRAPAATTRTASVSRSKGKSSGKAAKAVARGKAAAQVAARTKTKAKSTAVASRSSRATASASKALKPTDRQAKLDTGSRRR
jgi:D-alanyl-D-alanine carboxypeptidase